MKLRILTIGLMLCLALPTASLGQTADISGVTRDSQGNVLPGVAVTATSPVLIGPRTVYSDQRGQFRLSLLPPGQYTLRAELAGFVAAESPVVTLQVGHTLEVELTLAPGGLEETVNVSARMAVSTTRADLSKVIDQEAIDELPLLGRNFVDLVQLLPGVTRSGSEDQGSSFNVFGERGFANSFLVDGAENNNAFTGTFMQDFNQDAIQEFEVLLNGFRAEYGRASGAVLNIVTRSGADTWSGGGFLFARDDRLNATNVKGQPVPSLQQRQYGGTLGGPIIKERARFFGSLEQVDERRMFNFRIDAIPEPVRQGILAPPGLAEDFRTQPEVDDFTGFVKLTHRLATNHDAALSANYTPHSRTALPATAGVMPSNLISTTDAGMGVTGQTNHVLSNALFVQLSGLASSSTQGRNLDRATIQSPGRPAESIIAFFPQGTFRAGATDILREVNERQFRRLEASARVTRQVAWGRHDHQFKLGVNVSRFTVDGYDQPTNNVQLANPTLNAQNFSFQNAAFRAWGVSLRPDGGFTIQMDNNIVGLFAQDTLRGPRGVTVDVGLRYDWESMFGADKNNVSPRVGMTWDPWTNGRTAVRASWGIFHDKVVLSSAQTVPALGGVFSATAIDFTLPRLGASLDGDLNSAFLNGRGGVHRFLVSLVDPRFGGTPTTLYDVLSIPLADRQDPSTFPVVTFQNITALSGLSPQEAIAKLNAAFPELAGTLSWNVPGGLPIGVTGQVLSYAFQTPSASNVIETMAAPVLTPRTIGWNIGVERELLRGLSAEVMYIHRTSTNLLAKRQVNLHPAQRGEPGFGTTVDGGPRNIETGFSGHSDYQGITLSVRKRLQRRYSLLISYTFSDAWDNLQSSGLGALRTYTDNRDPELDYGRSNNALDHAFVASGAVYLPFDVTVSGVLHWDSGRRYSARGIEDTDGDGMFDSRARDTVRNAYRLGAYQTLDLRLQKEFRVGRYTSAVMLEAFNVLNRANVQIANNSILVGQFGEATAFYPGRELQLGIRFRFGGGTSSQARTYR